MAHTPSNPSIAQGVSRLSRSQAYAKKALFKKPKAAAPTKAQVLESHKSKDVNGAKNGKTRMVAVTKAPRFYAAEDAPVPKKSRKAPRPATLRASITPGTVLILLAGRYRGKRVVFLKQLESGLLLVTGPHKVNGVPVRRVNQAYVIATSTKVDISGVNTEKFADAYFKKAKDGKDKATEEALFNKAEKKPVDQSRVQDQRAVDKAILAALKKDRALRGYLNASFALSKGQFPHLLKF